MLNKLCCFLICSLVIINLLFSQEPQSFDRQKILQGHSEFQKLSYSLMNEKLKLSYGANQLLEERGYKLFGQNHEVYSPRKDIVPNQPQLIKVNVGFELENLDKKIINISDNRNIAHTSNDNIMTEDFEGDFPGIKWQTYGDPIWHKTNSYYNTGNYSIRCTTQEANVTQHGNSYQGHSHSIIICGPFDLSDANYAQLKYRYCLDIKYEKDWFFSMISTDGINFHGIGMSGTSGSWDQEIIHLNNVAGLGNVTGHSQVWIAFLFESDNQPSTNNGVYLDDIEIVRQQIDGGTPLIGWISGELTPDGNPYLALGNIGVAEGDELEIRPGVEIYFEGGHEFVILGLLKAIGTQSDSILFTSAKPNPSPGDWRGIGLYDVASGQCRIQYCRLEYGGYGSCEIKAGGV